MAWTAPNLWVTGQMVTAALLNTYVRDNLLTLSTHAHGGEAGDGDDELAGIDFLNLDDIGNPGTAGRLQQHHERGPIARDCWSADTQHGVNDGGSWQSQRRVSSIGDRRWHGQRREPGWRMRW